MQSPEQPSRGEFIPQDYGEANNQSIYEEPSDNVQEPLRAVEENMVNPQPASDEEANASLQEAVNKGLIYPPPPSFYQNMQVPPRQSEPQPMPPRVQPLPPPAGFVPPSSYAPPGVRPLVPPPTMPAQPPVKRSKAWIWIVVSVLGVALIVSGSLCTWGFYSIFNPTFTGIISVTTVATNYYQELEAKQYTQAYSELALQGSKADLTQDSFVQQATTRDTEAGPIYSYTVGQPEPAADSDATNPTSYTITVQVKRANQSYTALLTLSNINGSWKITDFDTI